MKKSTKTILILLLCILVIGGLVGGYIAYVMTYHPSKWLVDGDDQVPELAFDEAIETLDMMSNRWQDALPQTTVHDLLEAHFASPLPEGKTQKKAIVLGYDGCRVDNFRLLQTSKRSAINTLLDMGGEAVFSYAGGVPYPHANTQATSTAPGWCTMLTGVLADQHHITDNNMVKAVEPKTLLLSLPESGKINKSAFYVSWTGHFVEKDATYRSEVQYSKDNDLGVKYFCGFFDDVTRRVVKSDLKKKECSDFIFFIMEYTDHAGHSTGFTPQNIQYVSAFRDAEATACDMIETIQNRATYDTEDWLILITTDHGGINGSHGGPSFEERMTFIVSNKDILSSLG